MVGQHSGGWKQPALLVIYSACIKGHIYYTIGQRIGLSLDNSAYYVASKNLRTNNIVVVSVVCAVDGLAVVAVKHFVVILSFQRIH